MGRQFRVIIFVCFTFVLGLASSLSMAQSEQGGVVREIVIEGNQRIEVGTVLSYMLLKEGDTYDSRRVDRSLKSLFATGLFADVTIRRQGESLIVNVIESPVISRIAFEGNSKLKDDDLSAELSLRPRVIYTRSKVQNDVKRILTLYRRKGRFAATVEPKVIQLEQNRVDLVFEINEASGPKSAISALSATGITATLACVKWLEHAKPAGTDSSHRMTTTIPTGWALTVNCCGAFT